MDSGTLAHAGVKAAVAQVPDVGFGKAEGEAQ